MPLPGPGGWPGGWPVLEPAGTGAGYQAMLSGCARIELTRDVLEVSGPDADAFLQGQCSQDVEAIPEGGCAEALLLAPEGRIDALVRVTRLPGPVFLVDVEAGYGEQVRRRLQRFLIRTAAQITPLPWVSVGFRGPGAQGIVAQESVTQERVTQPGAMAPGAPGALVVLPVRWGAMVGVDVLGTPDGVASFDPGVDGVAAATPADVEAVRIRSGIPRMGAEITDRSIPAELGLVARTVSFTKGCYPGQELVARIDARGSNVPKRLVVLTIDVPAGDERDAPSRIAPGAVSAPPPGSAIKVSVGGEERGVVTSVQPVVQPAPHVPSVVALGLLHRRVATPAQVVVEWRDGDTVRAAPATATDLVGA